MALHIISEKAGVRKQYKAGEGISQHAVVYLSDADFVKEIDDTNRAAVAGVAEGVISGGVASGDPIRVMGPGGVISGVICTEAIVPGDRVIGKELTSGGGLASGKGKIALLGVAISGYVTTTSGYINLISGAAAAGNVTVDGTALACTSGVLSGLGGYKVTVQPTFASGHLLGIVGKALTSGGAGSGIQLLVTLGA